MSNVYPTVKPKGFTGLHVQVWNSSFYLYFLHLLRMYHGYMYMYNCDFFLPLGTSLCARTFVRNVGWGGHNSTVGLTLPEVWARSVRCVARGKPFKVSWPWAHIRQIPGFPLHPRGDWVSASPIPAYVRKVWMQTGLLFS